MSKSGNNLGSVARNNPLFKGFSDVRREFLSSSTNSPDKSSSKITNHSSPNDLDLESNPNIDQIEVNKIEKFLCLASAISAAMIIFQPINVPLSNIANQRYVSKGNYLSVAKSIASSPEGVSGFYKKIVPNTGRRIASSIMPMSFAQTFSSGGSTSIEAAMMAATIETFLSLGMGEVSERNIQSSSGKIPNYKPAASMIATRNVVNSVAIMETKNLSKIVIDKMSNLFPGLVCDENKDNIRSALEPLIKTGLFVMTTPFDQLSTKFSAGHSLNNVCESIKSNPASLFRGAAGRVAMGCVVSSYFKLGDNFAAKLGINADSRGWDGNR